MMKYATFIFYLFAVKSAFAKYDEAETAKKNQFPSNVILTGSCKNVDMSSCTIGGGVLLNGTTVLTSIFNQYAEAVKVPAYQMDNDETTTVQVERWDRLPCERDLIFLKLKSIIPESENIKYAQLPTMELPNEIKCFVVGYEQYREYKMKYFQETMFPLDECEKNNDLRPSRYLCGRVSLSLGDGVSSALDYPSALYCNFTKTLTVHGILYDSVGNGCVHGPCDVYYNIKPSVDCIKQLSLK